MQIFRCSQRCQREGGRGLSDQDPGEGGSSAAGWTIGRTQAEGEAVEKDIVDPTKGCPAAGMEDPIGFPADPTDCLEADIGDPTGLSVDIEDPMGSAVGHHKRESAAAAEARCHRTI